MSVAGRKWSARACRVRGRTLTLSVLTLVTPAWAEVPDYTLELQARTNLLGMPPAPTTWRRATCWRGVSRSR